MVDTNLENKPPPSPKRTRRTFLQQGFTIAAGFGLGLLPKEVQASPETITDQYYEAGKSFQAFNINYDGSPIPGTNYVTNKQMLDNICAGIDLKYYNNTAVDWIRKTADKTQRFLTAIGFLDVDHSLRYNPEAHMYEGSPLPYFCNTYLLDTLRLLLGNGHIGSRYNTATGKLFVTGINENPGVLGPNELYLDSNNLDHYMKTFGSTKYGWVQAKTEAELQNLLVQGYVCMGVTKQEEVEKGRSQDPGFCGHAYVLGRVTDGRKNSYCITQATRNIAHQLIPFLHFFTPLFPDDRAKITPENSPYNFWLCKIPETNEYI